MKTSSAKAKGRRCATETKEAILGFFTDLEPGDLAETPAGVTGPDLYLSPKAKGILNATFECKNQEKLNIWKALEQAESHGKDELFKLLVFKRNRSEIFCALRFSDVLYLIHTIHNLTKGDIDGLWHEKTPSEETNEEKIS